MYAIQYNKQSQRLEFSYRDRADSLALDNLFHNFGLSLANIVFAVCNVPVCRISRLGYNAIQYYGDIQYNELITDVVFLHGIYQEYHHHHIRFINEKEFVQWREAIQDVTQTTILKKLYADGRISRAYFFKYALNHPASLQDLIKSSLFANNTFGMADQVEKIDKLPLPVSIKEDLKLSFAP